jgi:predicted nucleotidyltransferase component of viral defense system
MIIPRSQDAFHKIQLYRMLIAILDDRSLSQNLFFKGGSCASMLGWLDRFSVDLDFDLSKEADKKLVSKKLFAIFKSLNLEVKTQAKDSLFFVLGYETKPGFRNSLKLGIMGEKILANDYNAFYLAEIDRYAICQTKETMVANKLVALVDRFEKHNVIAGRDIYDINYFLSLGYPYKKEVIQERRKTTVYSYLAELREFIKNKVTERIINEDLSYLLPFEKFKTIRKTLKTETLILITDEIKRLSQVTKNRG